MTIDEKTTAPDPAAAASPAAADEVGAPAAAASADEVGAFVERVLGDGTAAITMIMAALGDRLGLFRALAAGPATAGELAARAGIAPRYAREWLAAMAAAGYLRYEPAAERFTLPAAHLPVLALDDTPASLGGVLQWLLGVVPTLDRIGSAFRTGAGVPPSAYGPDLLPAIERLSGPWYANALVPVWLPHVPAVEAALRAGADVADVGCGGGRALLALAGAFPRSRFTGFDASPGQIERARANAAAAGLADRVAFEVRDAATGLPGAYDAVFTFDVVHDAPDPAGLLRAIAAALRPDGTCVCLEMRCGETLADNLHPLGALYYGVSTLYCLSVSLAGGGPGLGSFGLPPRRLAALCAEAGLTVRRLPIDDPLGILYEVRR
jgi:SAM-dependent methyltransferase